MNQRRTAAAAAEVESAAAGMILRLLLGGAHADASKFEGPCSASTSRGDLCSHYGGPLIIGVQY